MSMRPSASQMTRAAVRPDSFGALQSAVARHYDGLSKRLQQVAEYALTHPDDVALETIAVIAGRARVPPSSLIRFAKALGFEGFTEMQRLFRARLIERSPDYGERIRSMRDRHAKDGTATPALVLDEFANACVEALERLRQEVPNEKMAQAVEAMATADGIYIAAQRRALERL